MKRFLKSLSYALAGILVAIHEQKNLQIHFTVLLIVVSAGLIINITQTEWLAVILTAALVITAELFNSAIEKVVDLASPEFHLLAKQAKDIAAGAVLMAAFFSVLVGLIVFGGYLLQFLSDYL